MKAAVSLGSLIVGCNLTTSQAKPDDRLQGTLTSPQAAYTKDLHWMIALQIVSWFLALCGIACGIGAELGPKQFSGNLEGGGRKWLRGISYLSIMLVTLSLLSHLLTFYTLACMFVTCGDWVSLLVLNLSVVSTMLVTAIAMSYIVLSAAIEEDDAEIGHSHLAGKADPQLRAVLIDTQGHLDEAEAPVLASASSTTGALETEAGVATAPPDRLHTDASVENGSLPLLHDNRAIGNS